MTTPFIEYRSGYKYQLAADYTLKTTIKPNNPVDTDFIKLDVDGTLTVKNGFAWDGPSGPVSDNVFNMRASMVHDAFYQLMRRKKVSPRKYRDKADKLFQKLCVEDGVEKKVARAYYAALKIAGAPNAAPENKKRVFRAPMEGQVRERDEFERQR